MVSVIIPIYNAISFVESSINSVLSQTFQDWELILVDDGSTDGSAQLCDEFAKKDSRIKVIHIPNGGVSNARNVGLSIAKGDWIEFLDSDDLLMPNAIEILISHIDDSIDVVVCGYETFPRLQSVSYTKETVVFDSLQHTVSVFAELYKKYFYNSIWNKLYRRIKIVNNFDKTISLGEDLLFNLEFLSHCQKIKVIPNSLYRYRVDNFISLTRQVRKNGVEIQFLLKQRIDEAFSNDCNVCNATMSKFFFSYIGAMQLLLYDKTMIKAEKLQIISSWVEKYHEFFLSPNIKIKGLQKRLLLKYIQKKRIRKIYGYFEMKRKLTKILRPLRNA